MSLNTPNVYIQEQSGVLPAPLSDADTVTAFIGYTEKGPLSTPTRIHSLAEYEKYFGQAEKTIFDVSVDTSNEVATYTVSSTPTLTYLMYHSVQFYFANGGGKCYIVSVGSHSDTVDVNQLTAGLNSLEAEAVDLLLPVDAVQLSSNDYYQFCQTMLTQCDKTKDRFVVMDIQDTDTAAGFRGGVGDNFLEYGAVYTPYLLSTLRYHYQDSSVNVTIDNGGTVTLANVTENRHIHNIKALLDEQMITLPPSSAIAGIYADVDSHQGVWKSAANASIRSVIKPKVKLTNEDQASLNRDEISGKSINAIRNFHNQGTVIWGGRTLDGNSHDWRYISTKRFLIKIERDIRDIAAIVINEANIPRTWTKVKTLIEGYLTKLWQKGALSGANSNDAYFVQIGLGETMSAQDLLDGKLNITVGVATSRPAEFIIISFAQRRG